MLLIFLFLYFGEEYNVEKEIWMKSVTKSKKCLKKLYGPVGSGCRIHQRHLYRRVRLPSKSPGHDTKQPDGEAPVMLELRGIRTTLSLSSPLSPLWPGVVASDRFPSMSQIELNNVHMLNWIVWNGTIFLHLNCELMLN